jgi:hypothetical protein
MPRFFSVLRSVHSWLGFLILPWVIVYGITGFYLNHSKVVNQLLGSTSFDESQFQIASESESLSIASARQLAQKIWPDQQIIKERAIEYHGFASLQFFKPSGQVIVAIQTGHFYEKTRYYRYTYDPEGNLVDRKFYWSYLFRYFHEAGWIDNSFGVWFADITSLALIIFGLTGFYLFLLPRLRKLRRAVRTVFG